MRLFTFSLFHGALSCITLRFVRSPNGVVERETLDPASLFEKWLELHTTNASAKIPCFQIYTTCHGHNE